MQKLWEVRSGMCWQRGGSEKGDEHAKVHDESNS